MRTIRKSDSSESPRRESTMRLTRTLAVALVAAVLSFFAALPAVADDTTCNTTNDGVTNCLSQGDVSIALAGDEVSDSAHAVSRSSDGATILVSEWLVSKDQMQKAKDHGNCRWFKVVWNSGFKNGTGKMGWHKDYHVYGCLINGHWYKYGGGVTGKACGNLLRLIKSPPARHRVRGKVKWMSHFVFKAKVHVTSHANGKSFVTADSTNSDRTCHAHAEAWVHGVASASASASAYGSTAERATANASAKIVTKLHAQASSFAKANTKTNVQTWAMAFTSCTASQPPQSPPPTVISLEQPNDVVPNESRPECATVDVPSGHTGTVVFSASIGTFPNGTITGVSGQQKVCTTYVAPGETGTETITVYVRDDQTGLSASKSTAPFPVKQPPPPPA